MASGGRQPSGNRAARPAREGGGVAAVALALGASLAWGCSDFLAGLKTRRVAVLWVLLVSQVAGLALIVAAALAVGEPLPGRDALLWAAGAGVAELIGFAALYRALAVGVMSVVAPISATAAVVPVIAALAAGEALGMPECVGMTLALLGAALAALEPGAEGARRRAVAGLGLAIVAALGFGAFFVGIDMAADDGPLWSVAGSRIAAVTVLVAAVLPMRRPCPLDLRSLPPLMAVGALDIAANAMFALALTLGMAATVSVLGSLYPIATVLLARAILHEHVAVRQRTGVAAALAGIALVSLA
jgi:drug/metabolite transporter (DMT)-like permease